MTYSPLSISRRHVLGDLYNRCDAIESVPVYLNDPLGERIGFVDESLGHYSDAFCFHLAEDICKKLSSGHYSYSFNYDYAESQDPPAGRRRIKLNYICLTGRVVQPIGPRGKRAIPETDQP